MCLTVLPAGFPSAIRGLLGKLALVQDGALAVHFSRRDLIFRDELGAAFQRGGLSGSKTVRGKSFYETSSKEIRKPL